jgi:hypothetical protein
MDHPRPLSRSQRRKVRRQRWAGLSACVVGLVVAAVSLSLPRAEPANDPRPVEPAADLTPTSSDLTPLSLLPDLDQAVPRGLEIQADGRSHYSLGFRSAVSNVGEGPLIIVGSRPDRQSKWMQADQLVQAAGGNPQRIPNIGRLRYVASPDHSHWHYLEFDRYELQSYELLQTGGTMVRDRKSGFCLGDRYRVRGRKLIEAPKEPVFTRFCGLSKPGLIHVREGISVGYGDDYSAFLEGQSLTIDGLPNGRYLLIHRVNETGGLQESSRANNAASVLLALRWRGGRPSIRVLARCPNRASCSVAR